MTTYDSENDLFFEAARAYEEKRYDFALPILECLSKSGRKDCDTMLGYMYKNGLGTIIDANKADFNFASSTENGSTDAQFHYAEFLRDMGDYSRALALYEILAQDKNPSALYWLYVFYEVGYGVAIDSAKADRYLREAASNGHVYASAILAKQYIRGKHGFIGIFIGLRMVIGGIVQMTKALDDKAQKYKLH